MGNAYLGQNKCSLLNSFRVTVYVYITPPLCLCGIFGNIISIHIIGKDKVVRRATGFLLRVLALTDIFYLLIFILLGTLGTISQQGWSPLLQWYYPYVYPYVLSLITMAQTCEIWIILLISADRYIRLCKALKAARYLTMSRMYKTTILILVFSIIFGLPRFWETTTKYKVSYYKPDSSNQTVESVKMPYIAIAELGRSKAYYVLYTTCCFFIFRFGIPIISLAFFNARLVQAVKKSNMQMSELQGNRRNQNGNKLSRETVRYTITLLVLVLVFFICTTPNIIIRVWASIHKIFKVHLPRKQLLFVLVVSNLMLVINSCSNFIIYFFLGKRFRKIFYQMFRCT